MSEVKHVGFVGLGMMGTPMAARLAQAGYKLYIADADAKRVGDFIAEHDATPLSAANASELDVLITMLPNSNIVERVLLGSGEEMSLTHALRKGAVVIDMSSSEPARSRDLGTDLEKIGLRYLDAPVSGGVKGATVGSLAILVGGDATTLDEHHALLEKMGSKILHIGGHGAGHAAKALNNYVSAAGLLATVEALHVAGRFGIDPSVMTDVLNSSSGRSNTSENKVKQFMLSGTFASGFALQLMTKDLKIAAALAESVGYDFPLGKPCVEIWKEAAEKSTPTTDHTEMYRLFP
ncbi:NAD(P)-dependent oxidoreductase [Burkholderia cepacia]|uniref:NAD(P)-dependent oxidoreductase n=1 Tax=Burkholderia cepacia TaxID=292 RepID=UPI0029900526|nr:NAD(P)-dependent oxidoreductase [Burkholderia cepacia]MDW9249049.1 NADP oxidoreductase coenzyme F420-dependent family protein [Burkholderia cepacia]